MAISVQKVATNFGFKYMVVIPAEDALFYGIIKNATPREERNYPTWKTKSQKPEADKGYIRSGRR